MTVEELIATLDRQRAALSLAEGELRSFAEQAQHARTVRQLDDLGTKLRNPDVSVERRIATATEHREHFQATRADVLSRNASENVRETLAQLDATIAYWDERLAELAERRERSAAAYAAIAQAEALVSSETISA